MSKVIIPEKHYIGLQFRPKDDLPLGYITPYGADKAAQSRMATVDSWTKSRYGRNLPSTIVENHPMVGFKLTSSIRRGDYGAADKWRIIDPRGFELEISSSNLAMLLTDTTITNGEILDQCIWARDGGNNVLLSLGSNEYEQAMLSTSIASTSTSWSNVQIGNEIILQNGLRGRYLGSMYPIAECWESEDVEEKTNRLQVGNALHVIHSVRKEGYGNITHNLHLMTNKGKLSQIADAGNVLSVDEAELLIAGALSDPQVWVDTRKYRSIRVLISNRVKQAGWTLELKPIQNQDDDGVTVPTYAHLANGNLIRVDRKLNNVSHHGCIVDESLLADGILSLRKELIKQRFGRTPGLMNQTAKFTDADVKSWYKLELAVTSKTGNRLRAFV